MLFGIAAVVLDMQLNSLIAQFAIEETSATILKKLEVEAGLKINGASSTAAQWARKTGLDVTGGELGTCT